VGVSFLSLEGGLIPSNKNSNACAQLCTLNGRNVVRRNLVWVL